MTKHTKQAIIISIIILLTLCAASAVFVFRTDIQCLWWYFKCRTWEKDNEEYKLEVVKRLDEAKAVRVLCWMLKDNNADVREDAAFALGELADKRSVGPLIAALKDSEWSVRRSVVKALGRLGDQPSPELSPSRSASAEQGRRACRRAVGPLSDILEDSNGEVRRYAAWALGIIGDKRAVKHLIRALKDENEHVRANAAWGLGKIGAKCAIKPLKEALSIEKGPWSEVLPSCSMEEAIEKLESLPEDKQ